MAKRITYKDTQVQEGSQLYDLLQSNKPEDRKKAEQLYKECDAKFMKNWPDHLKDLLNWRIGDHPVNSQCNT